jgi:hypothetical protein
MGRYGRSHYEMAEMRARRLNDGIQDGRVQRQLRYAFWWAEGIGSWRPKGAPAPDAITTRYLLESCYPRQKGPFTSWQRTYVIACAKRVAIPQRRKGKGAGSGCDLTWTPIPEKLEARSSSGKWKRRQRRLGYPIDD